MRAAACVPQRRTPMQRPSARPGRDWGQTSGQGGEVPQAWGRPMRRRAALGAALALPAATAVGVAAAGCAAGSAPAAPGNQAPVEIKLSSWNYRTDLVRKNLDLFEQ